jgi:hypothetical protein
LAPFPFFIIIITIVKTTRKIDLVDWQLGGSLDEAKARAQLVVCWVGGRGRRTNKETPHATDAGSDVCAWGEARVAAAARYSRCVGMRQGCGGVGRVENAQRDQTVGVGRNVGLGTQLEALQVRLERWQLLAVTLHQQWALVSVPAKHKHVKEHAALSTGKVQVNSMRRR